MAEKTEITLPELNDMKACSGARILFAKIFDMKASVKDVVKRLHTRKQDYEYWEAWLLAQNPLLTITMLKNGADVRADSDYALCLAVVWDRTEVVKILLENGADVHAGEDFALRRAKVEGYTETLELLEQYS